MADTESDIPRDVGLICRAVPCCCKPGQGHKHPAWIAYEAKQRARERYDEAKASGLSDYEAREEDWPNGAPGVQENAVYVAIRGVLGRDYELTLADVRRAAHAAVAAFAAACNPPLIAVERDKAGRFILSVGEDAEDYGQAARAWVFRQLLAEREWLYERIHELPDTWTLCLHRSRVLGNELDGWLTMSYTVSVHQLPPEFVCAAAEATEQYVKPAFQPLVDPVL